MPVNVEYAIISCNLISIYLERTVYMTLKDYGLVFAVAFVIALVITPISIKIAYKIGVISVPGDGRRMHARNIPRLGGLAIFVATTIAMLIFGRAFDKIHIIVLGGALMYLVGLVDDIKPLKAWMKLLLQLAIVIMMYVMGVRINFIQNFFGQGIINFGAVTFLVSVLWMLGITNAINLIDGLDGLAAGTIAIDALTMAYISFIINGSGKMAVCVGMMALAGACVGFLPYNFSPAKTFMGDGGALYLGFMFAALTTVGRLKSPTIITMVLPVFVLAIPVFDTLFAIVRRLFKRKSVMDADKGHLHHTLMAAGHGHMRSVLMLYSLSGIMCVSSILMCRDLFWESMILIAIAITFIYVFLTDQANRSLLDGTMDDVDDEAPHLSPHEE